MGVGLGTYGATSSFNPIQLLPAAWYDTSVAASLLTDGAASFASASSQYLSCASNATLQTGDVDYWMAGWVWITSRIDSYPIMISKNGATAGSKEYSLLASNVDQANKPTFAMYKSVGNASAVWGSALSTGAWHFGIAYHDSVNDSIGISFDGGAFVTQATGGAQQAASTAPMELARENGATTITRLNGILDSVVFGKSPVGGIAALATTIRNALYNSGAGVRASDISAANRTAWGVVSGWDFAQPGAGLVADSIGTNTLTNNNAVTFAAGLVSGVASADGDPVTTEIDQSTNANNATQTFGTLRPVLKTASINGRNSLQPDAVDDVMAITAVPFTGAFTAWVVGTRALGTRFLAFGNSVGNRGTLAIADDNNVYFITDAGDLVSAAYTGATSTTILRFRRDASNVCYFAATGMAEVNVGSRSGTITINRIFARPGDSQYNGGTNKFAEMLLSAADLVTTNPSGVASYQALLASKWGVTIP